MGCRTFVVGGVPASDYQFPVPKMGNLVNTLEYQLTGFIFFRSSVTFSWYSINPDGIYLIGIYLDGIYPDGIYLNGIYPNDIYPDGIYPAGIYPNDIYSDGIYLDGILILDCTGLLICRACHSIIEKYP